MNDNVLTSYSFLAALSENETDIYKAVYLPLFKRAISSYAAKKSPKVSNSIQGTDIDIQSIILEEYGIEVPILIVRKLIKAVGTSLSKKERNMFKFDFLKAEKPFNLLIIITFLQKKFIIEKDAMLKLYSKLLKTILNQKIYQKKTFQVSHNS